MRIRTLNEIARRIHQLSSTAIWPGPGKFDLIQAELAVLHGWWILCLSLSDLLQKPLKHTLMSFYGHIDIKNEMIIKIGVDMGQSLRYF